MLFRLPAHFEQIARMERAGQSEPRIYKLDQHAPAFGDDLQIGRVVQARLSRSVKNYSLEHKNDDHVHPILVTALWRNDGHIEKIEGLRLTMTDRSKNYPDDFRMDTLEKQQGMASWHGGTLITGDQYILDNNEGNFPSFANKSQRTIASAYIPEVLVRRAYSIIYNSHRQLSGNTGNLSGLEREGVLFTSIPQTSVRNDVFVPEMVKGGKPSDILNQTLINAIVTYAVSVSEKEFHRRGNTHFHFPAMKDWTLDTPIGYFPDWTNVKKKERGANSPAMEL